MTTPALQSQLDQHAAYLRDWLDLWHVDLTDPDQRRAVMVCWVWLERHWENGSGRLGFVTLGQLIGNGAHNTNPPTSSGG